MADDVGGTDTGRGSEAVDSARSGAERAGSDRAAEVAAAGQATRDGLATAQARDAGLAAAGPTLQAAADRIGGTVGTGPSQPAPSTTHAAMTRAEATRYTSSMQTAPVSASVAAAGTITLSAEMLADLGARHAAQHAAAPAGVRSALRDAATVGNLARVTATVAGRVIGGAAGLLLTPSPLGGQGVVHPLGPDLGFRTDPVGTLIVRRIDGEWRDTGVRAERTLDGGVRIDRGALERAIGPLPDDLARVIADPLPWVEGFPALTEDERRLGAPGGFTPAPPLPNALITPDQSEWMRDLARPEGVTPAPPLPGVISTPIPAPVGPDIVEARRDEAFTTPGGNVIGDHGVKGDGLEYITRKGHTPGQIDDIIANPRPELSGIVAGRGRYKGQDMTLLTGQDGHWVVLSPEGRVVAVSNRNRPLRDRENEPDPIIRPVE